MLTPCRVQQLLRMSYAYLQMFLYRPFLHYVSRSRRQAVNDKRSYACAAACVSVSRNVIHITTEMNQRGLLIGAYWFVMYTTLLAIISLVFYIVENPDISNCQELLKDAVRGKEVLASLARRSIAADRCTQTLAVRLSVKYSCAGTEFGPYSHSLASSPSVSATGRGISPPTPPPKSAMRPRPARVLARAVHSRPTAPPMLTLTLRTSNHNVPPPFPPNPPRRVSGKRPSHTPYPCRNSRHDPTRPRPTPPAAPSEYRNRQLDHDHESSCQQNWARRSGA